MCGLLLGACCWFSCHGLEVLTSSCVWRASLGIGMGCATRCVRSLCAGCRGVFSPSWVLWRGFVRWSPCPVFVFLPVSRPVVGCTLLCSSAGCRCWAPAPGAAALAGLLRLALVYGRFGTFASSWFWGVFCVFGPVCLLVGPCWFSCHSLEVLTSSCVWWVKLWHGVDYSLRAFPMC